MNEFCAKMNDCGIMNDPKYWATFAENERPGKENDSCEKMSDFFCKNRLFFHKSRPIFLSFILSVVVHFSAVHCSGSSFSGGSLFRSFISGPFIILVVHFPVAYFYAKVVHSSGRSFFSQKSFIFPQNSFIFRKSC